MVARYLERRLEQLVEGLAGRVFRGTIQPAELASRLLREADLASFQGPAGVTVPNHFTVTFRGSDSADLAAAEVELASFVEDAAAQRGWRLGGPVRVRLVPSDTHNGRPAVTATSVPASRRAWGHLDFADTRVELTDNRLIVGRGADCDIILTQPEVSRTHALIYREGGQVFVEDRGSANGTQVNELPIRRAELMPGATVSFGTVMATLRLR